MAARREVVQQLQGLGLSERQPLRLVGMSASTLRYEPRDDGNEGLRERLKATVGPSTSSAPTGSTARKA